MLFRISVTRALLLTFAVVVSGCADPSGLEVTDARVREVIPGQHMTAGYFTARNTSDKPIVITGVESTAAGRVEMHTTVHDGGQVHMTAVPEVVVAPGETVRFEPGGQHLMLFGVSDLGKHVEMVLTTRDGQRIPVRFTTVGYGAD